MHKTTKKGKEMLNRKFTPWFAVDGEIPENDSICENYFVQRYILSAEGHLRGAEVLNSYISLKDAENAANVANRNIVA